MSILSLVVGICFESVLGTEMIESGFQELHFFLWRIRISERAVVKRACLMSTASSLISFLEPDLF